MKNRFYSKLSQLFATLSVLFLFSVSKVNAQTSDTKVFDYDISGGCNVCADSFKYNYYTYDSFLDATSSKKYIESIEVKLKFFSCYSGPLYLYMNGNLIATNAIGSMCSCNSCDSSTFIINSNNVIKYYNYKQKNYFMIKTNNDNNIYIDRTIIKRNFSDRFNYDAGIFSIDSPIVNTCPGSKNIKVKVFNNGKQPISSLTIDWKWNGVSQSSASISGTLDTIGGSGSNNQVVTIGSKTFTKGKIDTLKVWTKNPGGVSDSLNSNDTMNYLFYGSYSDTITVGGTSPMFTTVQAAVNALMTYGVCGPTYIKIRPGTYTEQVTINTIPGVSASNTVTFLSSTLDSSSVIISYNSTSSSNNFTVKINETKFINFYKISIRSLSTSYSRVVSFTGNVENIVFQNCYINAAIVTSTGSSRTAIYRSYNSSSEKFNNISILNSLINGGSYGIYFSNSYVNYMNGFYVRNCIFQNQYYVNIRCDYAENVDIKGNTLNKSNSSYTWGGNAIYFNNISDSMWIRDNIISHDNAGECIYISGASGSSTNRLVIANNFISGNNNNTSGNLINLDYCSYIDLVYNNTFCSYADNAYCLNISEGNNIRLFNNNFYNDNLGEVFNIISETSSCVTQSDNNNFYHEDYGLGNWYGNYIDNIDDLKVLGMDSNSVSVDPNYTSQVNLHTYNVDLKSNAKPYSGITKDIDGESRNSSTPDIGADEFKLKTLDAGIVDRIRVTPGTKCLKVVLKNFGSNTLTSAKIDWKLNGVSKTQVNWSGSLAKGDTDIVCLGNVNFLKDSLYLLKAWTSAPNSGTDSLSDNDTLLTDFYTSLSGEYTIGGTSPDFTTFTAAVDALNDYGIIDSVLFKVRNGTYTEQLDFGYIDGATRANSVIFQSESKDSTKVTLEYGSSSYYNNYVVKLDETRGLTFRKMRIKNFSSTYMRVFDVVDRSKWFTLENNIITNLDSTNTSDETALVYINYNSGSDYLFKQNVFHNGSYAININGSWAAFDNKINIKNNIFKNQGYQTIMLYNVRNIDLSGNNINENRPYFAKGIYVSYIYGKNNIYNNYIYLTGVPEIGIQLYNQSMYAGDSLNLYNNMISIGGTYPGVGIYGSNLYNTNIYYNSVLNTCTDSTSNSCAFYYDWGNIRMYNNNFVHLNNGYSLYISSAAYQKSNFNNLYTNGTKFVYWNGNSYSNLNSYKTASSNDTSSVSIDPYFTSVSNLHTSHIGLNAKAKVIGTITKDFDGDTRNTTTPDIGADEFTPFSRDASITKFITPGNIFKADSTNFEVVVTNLGLDTIKQITVSVKINNDTLPRKYVTRSFASGDTIIVKINKKYYLHKDSTYKFTAWSSLPNGSSDQKPSNDTLTKSNQKTALSGVYTIGGTSPNYNTFKAAVNDLKSRGIIDSVRFRVRMGTYTEQFRIPQISGASKRNSIIFESEDKDTTKVTLTYASSYYDTNYVVYLDGADGITFRYMTISATSPYSYNRIFNLRNNAHNNTIYKNVLIAPNTNYAADENSLIYSENSDDNNLLINNNHFKNGDYGVYLNGYAPYSYEHGLEISDNVFQNQYGYGIYLYYGDSVNIYNNYFYSDKYYYYTGLYANYLNSNIKINKNSFVIKQGKNGIYLYSTGNSFKRNLISNNALYINNNSSSCYGIRLNYFNYFDVIHNTVNLEGTNNSSSAIYGDYGGNNTFYNNNIVNSSGYSIYLTSTSTFTNLNYNNYKSSGSYLGYWAGTYCSNLTSWQTTSTKDTLSKSVNPIFYSNTNLHVKEVALNGAAKYFSIVPNDFDGQPRNTSTPDIGADEFDLPANDGGIAAIIVPKKPFPADSQWVKVVLKNYGSNAITSVSINWKFNGTTQTTKSWTGTLNSGDTVHVKLLKKFFVGGTPYSTKVWTTSPNGSTDPENTNDTTEELNQYPAMSGVYTIGGSSPDFANFNAAINAMKLGGIIDSVRFDVRDGTYNEQFRIPKIAGAENENSIIFQSQSKDSSKVILTYAPSYSNNWIVRIDSARGVTFRYMRFNSGGGSYNRIFVVYGDAQNINLHNCLLKGIYSSTSDYSALVYTNYEYSDCPNFNNFKIYKNIFLYGSFGVYSYGYSYNSRANNLNIYENKFENQYYMGLYIYYNRNLIINKNNIYHTNSYTGYTSGYGIYLYYLTEGYKITSNKIYNQEYTAISATNCNGAVGDSSLVANNFIHSRNTSSTTNAVNFYNNYYLNFYYNNIHIKNTNANSTSAYFQYLDYSNINNNNFVNIGNGWALYAYYGSIIKFNNNNYYTNGSKLLNRNGNSYANLSDWQTATSYDLNSLNVNPNYTTDTDLHTDQIDLNGKARNIKYIIDKDIDEQSRDINTPDIGADEYVPPAIDAGVTLLKSPGSTFSATTYDIIAIIKNFGTDTIKKVKVKIKINNDTLARKIVTKSIKTGDTAHVKLGQFTFHKDSTYNMYVWTFEPNDVSDQNSENDTLKLLNKQTALSGVYTIGGTTPDFTNFKAAVNALKTRGIIDSVRFRVRSGTYTEQLKIPEITGAGSRNSIIFESENKDTSSVTLMYNSVYSDTNYVVLLDGADGITFRYLIIKANSSSNYNRVISLKNGAHYNTIYKNIIEGSNTSWGSDYNALIYSGSDADNNTQIKDNHFKNGDIAIFLYGYPSQAPYTYEKGNEISGNKILNPYYRGIHLQYQDTLNISANYLYMDKYNGATGIYLDNAKTNITIYRNILELKQAYSGFNFDYFGTSFNRNLVSNNAIYIKNNSSGCNGIYFYSPQYVDLIHNSINVESSINGSKALYLYYGSYNNLFNNNFVNSGYGYSNYIYSTSNLTSNYNNLFSNSTTYFANWNGTNISNISAWKSTTSKDANSISVDPLYKAANNLHVKEMSLNAAGTYFSSVPLDFDYETRDNTHPDIGADEFQLPSNDAGVYSIIVPKKPFPADSQYVKVAIKNFGGNKIYQVNIGWTFNGVLQTPITCTDSIESGDTLHIKLAKMFFAKYTNHNVKVWTYSPNGASDGLITNDTMQVLNQQPAMSGVYTIGGASPDFATFNDAVNAMKTCGIIDSVRFDVRSGTYYEKFIIPYIAGANNENSIIFQSELKDSSKVVLMGTPSYTDNYVVRFDSTIGVTFRYLTLRTTLPLYYNRVVEMNRECKKINIHDCNLIGNYASGTDYNESVIYIYNSNTVFNSFNNIKIYRNNIINGSYGVYCNGSSNFSKGIDLKIYQNNFYNQYYMGMFLSYNRNMYLHKNIIDRNISGYYTCFGVYIQEITEGFVVTNNKISNYNYYGLFAYYSYGSSGDTSLIANNFIHASSSNSINGAYIYNCNYINFFNNNINVVSTQSSSKSAYFYSLSNASVCNNIFSMNGAGFAMYNYYGSFIRSDFNNFYTGGTYLMNYNGTSYTTLSAYKSASGLETNSFNVDPDYVSNTDLHIRATDLDGKGRNHKYLITKDIDDQNRNTATPDIGADEFDIPAANDAGILSYISPVAAFAAGSNSVYVVIKNFGSDSLKSATIKWRVNGNLQTSKSWTGKLKTGQTDTVNIGNYNFISGKDHDLKFWTTDPNGVADTTNYNDTLLKNDVFAALDGVYTVYGTLPDFADLNEAFNAIKLGGVIDTVWLKLRSGTHTVNATLNQYLGSSPNHPVIIESASGDSSDVVLTGTTVIYLSGSDYIKFKKLTFQSHYRCIEINNMSNGISFENCHFIMDDYWWYTTYGIYSGSSADDSLTVKNCKFSDGDIAIYIYGYPNSGSILEKNHIISNNSFVNQSSKSIYVSYVNSLEVTKNLISTTSSNSTFIVEFNHTQNKINFSYNKIIRYADYSSGLVFYNHVGTNTTKSLISNNFISTYGSTLTKGVELYNSQYINFYHNSLNQYGSATGTNSFSLHINGGANFDIRNNVIANTGSGYSMFYENSPSSVNSDYNDIYSSGTYIGRINTTDYSTLSNWQSATSKEANSISFNPSYVSNTDLHSNLAALDSACLYISSVTDDIDNESRNTSYPDIGADEFQSLANNLGVVSVIKPETTCGLDSTYIKLRVFNFGNQNQVNYPLKYKLSSSPTIQSVTITDTIKPGQFYEYQFAAKEAISFNTTLSIKAWTDLSAEMYRNNDSILQSFINYSTPDSVKFMSPSNGTSNIDFPFTLSWLPSTGATKYDIYIWDTATSKPPTPTVSNHSQISYQITAGLAYGKTYYWQVIAKNPICYTNGVVQLFTIRHLPDLIVDEVNGPHTAFSGTNISVSWKVKNQGLGATNKNWHDNVYLSSDTIWDITDLNLGNTQNATALNPSQSYNSSLSFTIPNGTTGNYYLIVFADKYTNLKETNDDNNTKRDTGKIKITLTPPPDLQVMSVSRPSVVFSGSTVNTTYTVKNKGTGDTRYGGWYDHIYLSTEKVKNGSSYHIGTNWRSGNLKVDSSYSVTKSVTIPNYISGKYFFVVVTDYNNNEYEYAFESNNSTGSDTIKVLLTPPPDLIVKNVELKDTVSNSENVLINYNVINDGGTSTGNNFYDALYLCPTPTFNLSISSWIGQMFHYNLASKDTSEVSSYFQMPKNINGKYYLFVLTDYYNSINEVSNEGNNTSIRDSIIIFSPDLIVTKVIVNSIDSTGSTTPIKWTVKNVGKGNDYQGLRYDSIFISPSSTWNRSNAKALGRFNYSNNLLVGDSIDRNEIVTIPDGYLGTKYFYVFTDGTNNVYEWTKENNNINVSDSMVVKLSPYPDLLPLVLSYYDSAEAGQLISLIYKVKNQGTNIANPTWKDKFYLSKDSTFNPTKVIELNSVTKSSILKIDSSYSSAIYFTLPNSIARGDYYYWVFTDAQLNVFEYTNDSNNKARSPKAFIDGYPPVDLKVNCPTIYNDTLKSGSTYSIAYSVTNIGDAETQQSSWNDGVYLSTDSILSSGDIKLKTIPTNKSLKKDSSYSISSTITIPNGTEGKYYLIVKTDVGKVITDVDTNNNKKTVCKGNGFAKLFVIELTPPPDLRFISWNVPSTAISGQKMKIKWKVENNGTGATRSGSWTDKVYLSTDYNIDGNDYGFGYVRHSGNVSNGGNYTDSVENYIPIDITGNYIVILKTDDVNEEYEHTNEGNNTVTGITTISKAPPADLIVSYISSPDSVISGKNINVTYKVKNIGSNPASGYLRDNIYLSVDNKQDASDYKINSELYSISLGTGSENTKNHTLNVSGVPLGDYYVIVSTDVMNNINEISDTNNSSYSSNKLNVNVPILKIGVKEFDTLPDNSKIYYRILIPDELEGETMLITLKADSIKGNNEMYVRFNDIASSSSFDYKHGDPFKGNQEIIIPELKKGTYYLLTTGKTSAGDTQKISLLARILPFEIRKVSPKKGGNTGEVTVLIEGSKFTDETIFMLLDTALGGSGITDGEEEMYQYSTSSPLNSNFIDPTKVYATFNLKGMKKSKYHVKAVKEMEETILKNSFTIEAGTNENLIVTMERPGNTRRNMILYWDIIFANFGNTDIVNKKLRIVSSGGAPIALDPNDLKKVYREIEVTVQGDEGPPNRLSPGGYGKVRIYTESSGALGITIIK
ncbi:MAG: right-handed parallel beta-helix repeat-containing protein [Bacteroidetes bacterium]|nr:right-handed parallel beta-helix repeat-containing protein [Bacteroidota bacterium]